MVLFAVLFLCGFLTLSLVFLSELRHFNHSPPPSPSPGKFSEDSRAVLEDVRLLLEESLLGGGISPDRLKVVGEDELLRYEEAGEFPKDEILKGLRVRLQKINDDVEMKVDAGRGEILVTHKGKLRFLLQFHRSEIIPLPAGAKLPRVAIIMDDLGRDLDYLEDLLDLGVPVTLAILPGEENAFRSAVLANTRGREVLIHIPMEPRSFPINNPGDDALFTGFSSEEIRSRFSKYVANVPHAVGGNNHMGSRFTEDSKGMATVMGLLKEEGFFFVDSLTTGNSIGISEARNAGIPSVARDVFLDNDADVSLISEKIRLLVRIARKEGTAVGICHPYPQTLEALDRMRSYLEEQGIEVVPVSHLLE